VHRVPEAVLAPGARIECRSAEWLVRGLGRSSDGQQVTELVCDPSPRYRDSLLFI
jgi:hypothetical protein